MTGTKLSLLSMDQLIWSMVHRLNRIHDSGGVSVGRSIRSICLQVALSYGIHYEVLRDVKIDSVAADDPWELVKEAQGRPTESVQLVLFNELTLTQATDRQLVVLAMNEMGQWYNKDRERRDPVSSIEYDLAKEVIRLLATQSTPCYKYPERKLDELRIAWGDREYEWFESTLWSHYQTLRKD